MVFDEAQQIKNPASAQTRAASMLRAGLRVALTGTPVENRLSELWSIMHVLKAVLAGQGVPRAVRRADREEPRSRGDRSAPPGDRPIHPSPFEERALDHPDLPDKIETVDRCPLTREQATLYQAVVDDMLAQADEADGIQRRGIVLAGLLRLKQVCNHPAHFLADGSPFPGRSGKLPGPRSCWRRSSPRATRCSASPSSQRGETFFFPTSSVASACGPCGLYGNVRRPARDEMVKQFDEPEGPPLFLVSLKAGGTGLNLTAASHVIHLDRWWNPAVEDQATDRAYRIGQRRNVQVHKLVSAGTVEERIDEMIAAKRDLAARVVGTGEDWLTELSSSDLRNLVALADGGVDRDGA